MNNQDAKKLLLEVKSVLDDLEIEFFLLHGTALGAFREGDFISYDRDIDLGINEEVFRPKAKEIRDEFFKRGFKIWVFFAPCELISFVKIEKYKIRCDVIGYSKLGEERFAISRLQPFCSVFSAKLFEKFETIKFCGTEFNLPSPAIDFIKEIYGEDWKIPMKSNYKIPSLVWGYRRLKKLSPSFEETKKRVG